MALAHFMAALSEDYCLFHPAVMMSGLKNAKYEVLKRETTKHIIWLHLSLVHGNIVTQTVTPLLHLFALSSDNNALPQISSQMDESNS